MPRLPRCFPPGSCHHLIQRGNDRHVIFRHSGDYEVFLGALAKALGDFKVTLHAYTLMTTHIHLIVTPSTKDGIGFTMQALGRTYGRHYNQRYGRTGGLYEGRYRTFPIESEAHWFNCMRYVEQNPVRAGMVANAAAYRWSSHRFHVEGDSGHTSALLTPHPLYLALGQDAAARQLAWRAICGVPLTDAEIERIRAAVPRRGLTPNPSAGSDPKAAVGV